MSMTSISKLTMSVAGAFGIPRYKNVYQKVDEKHTWSQHILIVNVRSVASSKETHGHVEFNKFEVCG